MGCTVTIQLAVHSQIEAKSIQGKLLDEREQKEQAIPQLLQLNVSGLRVLSRDVESSSPDHKHDRILRHRSVPQTYMRNSVRSCWLAGGYHFGPEKM